MVVETVGYPAASKKDYLQLTAASKIIQGL
jgi:hypothetical protein